ncbi:hypothetical protein [Nostoc sp.]
MLCAIALSQIRAKAIAPSNRTSDRYDGLFSDAPLSEIIQAIAHY